MSAWRSCLCVLWAAAFLASLPALAREAPHCQLLDRSDQSAWYVLGSHLADADVEVSGGRSFSAYEVRGGGGLYFAEVPGGLLEVGGAYGVRIHEGGGGVDLPREALGLHLDLAYQWRHWDGRAFRVALQPGLYGELDGLDFDAFRVPFSLIGYQTLSPRLSALLGVAIYPGCTRAFDPRFGVRYALSDAWSLDLQYPESGLLWRSPGGAEFYLYYRNQPVNEYRLEEGDTRRSFRFEETRAAAGWVQPVGGLFRIRAEAGLLFNRSIDFARESSPSAVENAFLLGVGIEGPL